MHKHMCVKNKNGGFLFNIFIFMIVFLIVSLLFYNVFEKKFEVQYLFPSLSNFTSFLFTSRK